METSITLYNLENINIRYVCMDCALKKLHSKGIGFKRVSGVFLKGTCFICNKEKEVTKSSNYNL